ncbi:helix-turn-helix domain-containing protein [Ligilactobacillus faecis]|uniref:Helix-turn-helix domain-containing protein n=1 Tax=Ligilactobacillus faecis TaxID=762833 RepID=A0ABV4DRN6_9LACO
MTNLPLPQTGSCPVATTVSLLSSKWKLLIVRDLLKGTKRYSELKQSVASVSQKRLTRSLRELEQDGLVLREVFPVIPPRVEYRLSPLGDSLRPLFSALKDWDLMYLDLKQKESS